jgi:hypothetical protein
MGAVVLVGGLMITGWGFGVTSAAPPAGVAPAPPNPLTVIIDKLDQVLAAITGAAGQSNHTLRWDTNNASATRFTTAFTGAVLDNNTGLVWEQAPDGTPRNWFTATSYCVNKNVGGTVGWRLPSVVELKSVQDGSTGAVAPFVPASAFTISTSVTTPGVQSAVYWSASTNENNPTNPASAWDVGFHNGNVGTLNKSNGGDHAWCVRGGMNADAY